MAAVYVYGSGIQAAPQLPMCQLSGCYTLHAYHRLCRAEQFGTGGRGFLAQGVEVLVEADQLCCCVLLQAPPPVPPTSPRAAST
jgi:hypothetical protein